MTIKAAWGQDLWTHVSQGTGGASLSLSWVNHFWRSCHRHMKLKQPALKFNTNSIICPRLRVTCQKNCMVCTRLPAIKYFSILIFRIENIIGIAPEVWFHLSMLWDKNIHANIHWWPSRLMIRNLNVYNSIIVNYHWFQWWICSLGPSNSKMENYTPCHINNSLSSLLSNSHMGLCTNFTVLDLLHFI